MMRKVLLVDDDMAVRDALGQTLELAGCTPVQAGSFVAAKDQITPDFPGIIVSDIRMPGRDGFHLLDYARRTDPDLPVILLTGQGDIPMAVQAMHQGAFSFLEKPCAPATLMAGVERALSTRAEALEARRLKFERDSGDAAARLLCGTSQLAQGMREAARRAARAGADVLIEGEAGSGTPKMAEVIHLLSSAAHRPFVKRRAAGLTAEALEAALEQAGAGTLYLDDVTGLRDDVQFALLDRMEGGLSVRIIAGTMVDLEQAVRAGQFSADLKLRLDLIRVRIPSLHERIEDIPVLFRHYVALACEQANLPTPDIPDDLLARLMAQPWPGNARALMNVAMRFAMGLSDEETTGATTLKAQMAAVERSLLIAALQRSGGRGTVTAEALGLPRKTFYDKLAKYDLRAEDYRAERD